MNLRKLFLGAIFAVPLGGAMAQQSLLDCPVGNFQSHAGRINCEAAAADAALKETSAAYDRAVQAIDAADLMEPDLRQSFATELKGTQDAWNRYVTLQCGFEEDRVMGTAGADAISICRFDLAQHRTKYLRGVADDFGGWKRGHD